MVKKSPNPLKSDQTTDKQFAELAVALWRFVRAGSLQAFALYFTNYILRPCGECAGLKDKLP